MKRERETAHPTWTLSLDQRLILHLVVGNTWKRDGKRERERGERERYEVGNMQKREREREIEREREMIHPRFWKCAEREREQDDSSRTPSNLD